MDLRIQEIHGINIFKEIYSFPHLINLLVAKHLSPRLGIMHVVIRFDCSEFPSTVYIDNKNAVTINTKYKLTDYFLLSNRDKCIHIWKMLEEALNYLSSTYHSIKSESIMKIDELLRTSLYKPEVRLWKSKNTNYKYELCGKYEFNYVILNAYRHYKNESRAMQIAMVDASPSIYDVVFFRCRIDNGKLIIENDEKNIAHIVNFDDGIVNIDGSGIFSNPEKLNKMLEYVSPGLDSKTRLKIMMEI